MSETKKENKTDFQGPVSLEAIMASKAGKKSTDFDNKEPKQEKAEPKVEEAVAEPPKEQIQEEPSVKVQETPPVTPPAPKETDAYKVAKRLIASGMLEDFEIEDPENEEGSIKVSEFTSMSDDNLEELIKLHQQEKNKEISSKYIPKEGLKEHQLKVIEILQNGGDLSQIAETPDKAFERPFEGLDMEEEKDQIEVLYADFTFNKQLSHQKALALIKQSKEDGTLKEEAEDIFKLYRDSHAKYIDDKLKEQKKDKEFKELNFKENKKTLTEKLKESGVKEAAYRKVVADYGSKNDKGESILMDKFREVLNNPEENFEIIFHLADKKTFDDIHKIKTAQATQREIVRLSSSSNNKGNKSSASTMRNTEQTAPWHIAAEEFNEALKRTKVN